MIYAYSWFFVTFVSVNIVYSTLFTMHFVNQTFLTFSQEEQLKESLYYTATNYNATFVMSTVYFLLLYNKTLI